MKMKMKTPGMYGKEEYLHSIKEWTAVTQYSLGSAADIVPLPIGGFMTRRGDGDLFLRYGGPPYVDLVRIEMDPLKNFIENYEIFIAQLICVMESTDRNPQTVRRFFRKLENL